MSTGQPQHADESNCATPSGVSIPASSAALPAGQHSLTLSTIGLFLIGNRRAILTIAESPLALRLAGVWVLLAALFRDYDHADLLRFPGWLAVPLLASTTLTVLLFGLLQLLPAVAACPLPFLQQFRRLLTCFWMTAPLAVIYAIPVERFCTAGDAMQWNLTFLAVVAAWRVLLISRVVGVLYDMSTVASLFPIMLLADALALVVMLMIPIPLLQIMGGIRLSEQSEIINAARLIVILLGAASWLIWLIGTGILVFGRRPERAPITTNRATVTVHQGPWLAASFAFSVMLIACCFTQPEQQRAARYRSLVKKEPAQALRFLSHFNEDDLPPHWDPPPRIDYLEQSPRLFTILRAIAEQTDTPDWIRQLYAEKLLSRRGKMMGYEQFWYGLEPADLKDLICFLKSNPDVLRRFDKGGPHGEFHWEDGGSIRCTVGKLLKEGLKLPGTDVSLPIELVEELFELDDASHQRGCGTHEEIQQLLQQWGRPASPPGEELKTPEM